MTIAIALHVAFVLAIAVSGGQDIAHRNLGPKDIRLEELQPWGWRIGVTSPAAQFEVRTLIAGRIRAFNDIYQRGGRLIGVGTTTSGEGFLVWDLDSQCQVTGAMGFGIKKSPDGRFVFFQQYVARGENPTGSVYRVVDIDAGSCPVAPPVEESLRSIVAVGDAILPLPPQDSAMASTLEGRSPMEWIDGALVFVTRNSATNVIELRRYNPHSKRVSSRTLDWRPLASSEDLAHSPHPSAAFSFKSVKAVGGEDGPGMVRLQLVDDYLHAAKWVDVPLPPAR